MSILVSIDLGNSNSMFSMTTRQGSAISYNCLKNSVSNEKSSSDLYVVVPKNKKKVVTLTPANTSFKYSSKSSTVCLTNYKSRLCRLVSDTRANLFQPAQLQFQTGGYKFQLTNIITTAYQLIVAQAYEILMADSQFEFRESDVAKRNNIKWVITVPSLSTNDMQIFMRDCMFQAVKAHQRTIDDTSLFVPVEIDHIITVQEPVAAFFQIKYERQLHVQEDSLIFVADFGGSTIDISVFRYCSQQGIPILLGQVGLNQGGSYIDQHIITILQEQIGITGSLGPFLQEFQKQKQEIFNSEDTTIDLYPFQFDLDQAEQNISELSDHLAFDPDDKLLIIDRVYFQDLLDGIIKETTDKLSEQFNKFGVPSFIFLAGGFISCAPLKMKIQQFLNPSGVQTFICNQPSTTISMGAARVLQTQSSRVVPEGIILQFNNQSQVVCQKGETIDSIRTLDFQFPITSKQRQMCTVQVADGQIINEEVLFSPRFVDGINIRVVVLPFSSGIQTYYTWQYRSIVDSKLVDMASPCEFQLQAHDYLQSIDCGELDSFFNSIQSGDRVERIVMVIISQILRFECIYLYGGLEIGEQQCDLVHTVQLVMRVMAESPGMLLFNSKRYGIEYEALSSMKYLIGKIDSSYQDYSQQVSYHLVATTLQKLSIPVAKFTLEEYLQIPFPGNTVVSDSTLLVMKNGSPAFTIHEPKSFTTAALRLGKGFIHTLSQQVIWTVLNSHGLTQANSQIEVIGSHHSVVLYIKASTNVPYQRFQTISAELHSLAPVVALMGKSIVTYDQASYNQFNYTPCPAVVALSSIGSNLIEYQGWRRDSVKGYYKLTYNNLLRLVQHQDLLYLSKHTLSIDVVMDLANPHLDGFISSDYLFSVSQSRIQTQLVIFAPDSLGLESPLYSTSTISNSPQHNFITPQTTESFQQLSQQNCCECESPAFYPIPVLKINSADNIQPLELCKTCLLTDVTSQLKQDYSQFIAFKKDELDNVENETTIYPIIQLAQVVFSSFYDIKPLLLRIYAQYLASDKSYNCCPTHKCAGLSYLNNNSTHRCQNTQCDQIICNLCGEWHSSQDKCQLLQAGIRKCRRCAMLYEKSVGCNHMACKCGAHNCYVCQESFQTDQLCYAHLAKIHGGFGQ